MNSGPIEPFNFSDLPNLIDLLPLEEVDKDPGLPKHTLGKAGSWIGKGRKTFSAGKQAAGKEEKEAKLKDARWCVKNPNARDFGKSRISSHLRNADYTCSSSVPNCPRVKTKMSQNFVGFQKTQISQWISPDNGIARRQECVRFVQ